MLALRSRLRRALLLEDWADSLQLWIAFAVQLSIFGVLLGALQRQNWLVAFTATLVFTLTFLPAIIERHFRVHLPVEFTVATCIFLYAAFALGEVRRFYDTLWWWDLMLHSFSALVMGLGGFLFVYVFYKTRQIRIAPIYVAVISFGFAVTLGTLWEIFEFLMDQGFGFSMQRSGLVDTMTDLMVDAVGGLIAAWVGYHYVKDGDSLIADRLVRRFVAKNPGLFGPRNA
jgi:hypothetical protein